MTKITIDRSVVEQALHVAMAAGYPVALIAALRAALEEPQSTHSADCYQWHHKCAIAEVERLRAALTEPVQEAVAWMYVNSDGECEQIEHETPPDDPSVTPLYTAPPQRKPLTEVELEMAYREIWRDLPTDFDHTSSGWIEQGIKYAERAHGIGETK